MGVIYCLMGKSASGKDSIYREILKRMPGLLRYVCYTTRPKREGEIDGGTYHFISEEDMEVYEARGKVIESRIYHTVYGKWIYATIDDGQIDPDKGDYLLTGTLESCRRLKEYFGAERVAPLYIEVEDGERLTRALLREKKEAVPGYAEVCRRFLADAEDFSEEKIAAAGIKKRYVNDELGRCADEIAADIKSGAGEMT